MQIRKMDRQAAITGAEECSKTETSDKPKSSKGIAESESKFETAKSNPLFQDQAYSGTRGANSSRSESQQSGVPRIIDGTSNTIVIGEQNPTAQDVQVGPPLSGRDRSAPAGEQNQQTDVPAITDGTSNTITIGEQNPPAQDVQVGPPLSGRDGSAPADEQNQPTDVPAITDGTSNTLLFGEENSDSTQNQSSDGGNVSDGTSNTIFIGEETSDSTSEDNSTTTNSDGNAIPF